MISCCTTGWMYSFKGDYYYPFFQPSHKSNGLQADLPQHAGVNRPAYVSNVDTISFTECRI